MPSREQRDAWELRHRQNPQANIALYCVNGHRVGAERKHELGWAKRCRKCGAGKPFLYSWELN